MPEKPVIRPLAPEDWDAVRAIYLEGLATGNATYEKEAPSWEEWDAGHLAACRLAAECGGKLAGWAVLSPVSTRKVYAGVAEVSIYIAEGFRRSGIGRVLLAALIEQSEQAGIWTLQSSIFPENTASVALHERLGFRIFGRRERIGCMDGRWRDVLLLERRSVKVGI
jgi:L-amino acid N-acyltransferase YncA